MKRCTKCGEQKPLDQYYAAKGGRDGLRAEFVPGGVTEIDILARKRAAALVSASPG